MKTIILVQMTFFTLSFNGIVAELLTSFDDLEPLLETHRSIIESLEKYLNEEFHKYKVLMTYLYMYKKAHEEMEGKISTYVGNPINVFTLVKRLSADLKFVERIVNTKTVLQKRTDVVYPTKEDMEGTAMALSRVQDYYDLDIKHLAQGVMNGTFSHGHKEYIEKTSPLSASDCFVIGLVLFNSSRYDKALKWFFEALQKYENKSEDDIYDVPETQIFEFIRISYEYIKDYKSAWIWAKKLLSLKPEAKGTLKPVLDDYENKILYGTVTYKDLCRGNIPVPSDKAKTLRCYYITGPHSFLLLARIKAEQLWHDPHIMLAYDMISDGETENIITTAQPKMSRCGVVDRSNGSSIKSDHRISKCGWVQDTIPAVERVSRRASDISGLTIDTAELLQIVNYGIGGIYESHHDFTQPHFAAKDPLGYRVATVLYYMSDVEQGGATVFVDLKLTVFPVKHAALFWMNLHASGEPDYRTRHAACPVLRGSKWVSTKWLHIVGQEFRRPCTLKRHYTTPDYKIECFMLNKC